MYVLISIQKPLCVVPPKHEIPVILSMKLHLIPQGQMSSSL